MLAEGPAVSSSERRLSKCLSVRGLRVSCQWSASASEERRRQGTQRRPLSSSAARSCCRKCRDGVSSGAIILMPSAWLLAVLTRKAHILPWQGRDPQTAPFLLALLHCIRNLWLMLLPASLVLRFQWATRKCLFCIGSDFFLLVSHFVSPRAELKTVVAPVVLPLGWCLASLTSSLVYATPGWTHCVRLDFCRKSCAGSVPLIKLLRCQRASCSLFCMPSDIGVHSDAVWNKCLEISPGQPFRLHLLRILAELSNDPDSAFTDQLAAGVLLGVQCNLQPCAVTPGLPPDVEPRPLECCTLSWQSALSNLPAFSKAGFRKSLADCLRCVSDTVSVRWVS